MTNRAIILKTVAFIEDNLTEAISVADMANESSFSRYHFIRLFSSIAGISPKKYLLQRRLTESIRRLRHSNDKVVHIAFDYQFGSHEAFTRSFSRQFGISPSEARKGTTIAAHLTTSVLTESYLAQKGLQANEKPVLVEMEAKILAGFSYFVEDDVKIESFAQEWGNLMKEVETLEQKVLPLQCFQVQYWSDHQQLDGMHYFMGVEVENIAGVGAQFAVKFLPKGTYLKFVHKGLSKNVGDTYAYIYREFLPDTNYKLVQPFNFEHYSERYLSPFDPASESDVYIPVVAEDKKG